MATATLVTTGTQYAALLDDVRRAKRVAVDFETTGLDPLRDVPLLLAVCSADSSPWVLPLNGSVPVEVAAALAETVCVAHNALFEYKFLAQYAPVVPQKWFCTQVAEGLIQSGLREAGDAGDKRVSLAEVRQKYLGLDMDKSLQTSFVGVVPATFVPTPEQVQYAGQDVDRLLEVMEAQLRRLESEGLLRVTRLEMSVLPVIGDMELEGMRLNLDRHSGVVKKYQALESENRTRVEAELTALYAARIERQNVERAKAYQYYQDQVLAILPKGRATKNTDPLVKARATELRKLRDKFKPLSTDFNLGSHEQVWQALAESGTELYQDTFEGPKPSLDKNVVRHESEKPDANPVLKDYAAWAKAAKVVSTYGKTLADKVHPRTGRVHSSYNQIVSSGRLSSYDPNRQNMPPDIRECSESEAGAVYVVADMVNQEGRIAACLSRDTNLLTVFREGMDWHSMTAALAYPEKYPLGWTQVQKDVPGKGKEDRAGCKNANFSSIYGGTEYTLYSRGYVPSVAIGKRLMDAVYTGYPKVREYALATADKAVSAGYAVTVSGRKRYFRLPTKGTGKADFKEYKRLIGGIRRAAMNHPVQGSGADVMKQAMVLLRVPMQALGFRLVASVHDELVYEGPEARAQEAQACVEKGMLEAAACFFSALPIPAESHVTKTWKK